MGESSAASAGLPAARDLARPVVLDLLARLDHLADPAAVTLYSPPGSAPDLPPPFTADLIRPLGEHPTGLVVFAGADAALAVAPPFAVPAALRQPGYVTEPLRELIERERRLAVILLRLGGYSVGLWEGHAFVETKTGGRFIKNRHRKGGQSQRRFDRIREGHIREHFDDLGEIVRTRLLPVAADLDAVVLGGDRLTMLAQLKRAPLPPALAAKVLPRFITTREPRLAILEQTPAAIWTSRAVTLRLPA